MKEHYELLGIARGVLEFSPLGPPRSATTLDGYRRYATRWLDNPGALRAILTASPRSTQRFAEAALRHELLMRLDAETSHLRDALELGDEVGADKWTAKVRQCLDLLREVRPNRRGRRTSARQANQSLRHNAFA